MPDSKNISKKGDLKNCGNGSNLQRRAANWLKSQFGYRCSEKELARGRVSKFPHKVGIHCIKQGLFGLAKTHLWVECKTSRVEKIDVKEFIDAARDVREAHNDNIEKWAPRMLMIISKTGFGNDAIDLAIRNRMYLVKAGIKFFNFVGKMKQESFEDKEESEY